MKTTRENLLLKINRGVRPYGGRTFPGREVKYPNGRVAYLLNVSAYEDEGWVGTIKRDEREYGPKEITIQEVS